jgi:hypothetical protein
MNHEAEIEGINNCPAKSESAIMACDSVAALPGLRNDAFGLIGLTKTNRNHLFPR